MEANGVRRRRRREVRRRVGIMEDAPFSVAAACPPPSPSPAPAATGLSPCPPPSPGWSDGDQAAGPTKRISLSDPGPLQKVCCCIPGLMIFPPMLAIVFCSIFAHDVMVWIAAVLSVWTVIYTGNLAISAAFGAWRMRHDVSVDWQAKLEKVVEEAPESSAFMHIVFLPNYREDEGMMLQTLQNLGRSALAREHVYVVLCMEGREGEIARRKAANLIDASRHLFADISATFHPENCPGDVAGKSSNQQWAYRQVLQRLAPQLSRYDASQIFLTVSDADSLVHPQYFSAMTYQGLTMSAYERAWSIWQAPILLLRNLFSSPAPTRLSGYATIVFELAGLANQKLSPHFSYSTYSFTLAMGSHRFVDGWDRDVIAEDHHMFCKCYFASIWEQLEALTSGSSQQQCAAEGAASHLRLRPVFLPAISYSRLGRRLVRLGPRQVRAGAAALPGPGRAVLRLPAARAPADVGWLEAHRDGHPCQDLGRRREDGERAHSPQHALPFPSHLDYHVGGAGNLAVARVPKPSGSSLTCARLRHRGGVEHAEFRGGQVGLVCNFRSSPTFEHADVVDDVHCCEGRARGQSLARPRQPQRAAKPARLGQGWHELVAEAQALSHGPERLFGRRVHHSVRLRPGACDDGRVVTDDEER
ncbi:unnamed protein product [Prorocentrum cordatum]|uniref:Glycosyltransferase 2-like domain-containing protein n=1 Tax=Prorocentrum cordatum TaxID=2364126 RepID=A0ABN9W9T4_9DINO|nr:unnamed protein product [Polarella glacialis]